MINLANASSETPPVRLAKAGATRVLVVDDEPTLRRSVVRMLTASGMEAIPVEDGSAALALLERERVHVALVDLMMPKMNGLELTKLIKATPSLRDLPVILLTALGKPEQREAGLQAGANAYLIKSQFDQRELLEMIKSVL